MKQFLNKIQKNNKFKKKIKIQKYKFQITFMKIKFKNKKIKYIKVLKKLLLKKRYQNLVQIVVKNWKKN